MIGASGDVGQGIGITLLKAGWRVTAVARNISGLKALSEECRSDHLSVCTGDVSSEDGVARLWSDAIKVSGQIDAVIMAVSAEVDVRRMLDWRAEDLLRLLNDNVMTHFNTARYAIPRLGTDGIYIGIGGGMADYIAPASGHISMCQAALRTMYQAIHAEQSDLAPTVKELMIMSMVNGLSRRHIAQPNWITDVDVGLHVLAILQAPENFPGPVLKLKSRKQVGVPEA